MLEFSRAGRRNWLTVRKFPSTSPVHGEDGKSSPSRTWKRKSSSVTASKDVLAVTISFSTEKASPPSVGAQSQGAPKGVREMEEDRDKGQRIVDK
jgi:hypothetical protein